MRTFFACTASLALLCACTPEASDEADTTADVAAAPTPDTMESYVGDWNVIFPDGSTAIATNNADGSYKDLMDDGTVVSGLWSFGEDKSCWQPDGSTEADCYTVSAPDEHGTRTLTAEDGTTLTVSPVDVPAPAEM